MATTGACLVANEPTGLGKAMIEARAKGKSWKEIADEFGLPNPSAARKAFLKETGIDDFKTKGPAIYNVKPGTITKGQTDNVVEAAAKDAAEAIKPNTPANAPSPPQPLPKTAMVDQHDEIVQMFEQGHGYVAIKNKVGVDFPEIDSSVWSHLLKKEQANWVGTQAPKSVWNAYKKKPTSENGFNAVKTQVLDLKKAGYQKIDITKTTGIPDTVVDAIANNTWSMPPMGSTSPIVPLAPPPPAATYVYNGPVPDVANRGYNYTTDGEMVQWLNSLGEDLTASEKEAIQRYTGSTYYEINSGLRSGGTHRLVKHLDTAMRPAPRDLHLVRQTSYADVFKNEDPNNLVGTVYQDKGFLSTTIQPSGVWSGNMRLEIHVPQGTMGRYVRPLSNHKSEYEYLLGRETPMMITKVEVIDKGHGSRSYIVHVQVLP